MASIEAVYDQIREFASQRRIGRVTLFGSRARGTNASKSDIDLAVSGGGDYLGFVDDVQERLWSLLEVDVVNLDEAASPELRDDINRDGVILYEAL